MPRVSLFVTCLVDLFFPEIGEASVNVLRHQGVQVDFPRAQICCGQPVFNSGFRGDAAAVARRTIDVFKDAESVVLPCGSCTDMVREHYPHLFDDPGEREQAQQFAAKCYELSEYLTDVLAVGEYPSQFKGKVTYHDSCHMCRGLGLKQQPRQDLAGGNGEVITFMPATELHQRLVSFLERLLGLFTQLYDLGKVRIGPYAMRAVPGGKGRESDVMFVATENLSRMQNDYLHGPADLVVEI